MGQTPQSALYLHLFFYPRNTLLWGKCCYLPSTHFTDEKNEAQRSSIIFSRSHIWSCHFSLVQSLSRVQLLRPHEPQHARPPCPSLIPGVYPNSCPLSRWCHSTISSAIILFSSCPQSFPTSGSFQMSQLFASRGQSIGVSASASVLPVNTQDWSALG